MEFDELAVRYKTVVHSPESEYLYKELDLKISRVIASLPERCRLIYLLVKEDGLKYKDVAELLDISIKTVDSQMAIALKRLREHVGHFLNQ